MFLAKKYSKQRAKVIKNMVMGFFLMFQIFKDM